MSIATWLICGTLIELADRMRLFRVSIAESARRFWHMPRAGWGMTLAHLGLALAVVGVTGAGAWNV